MAYDERLAGRIRDHLEGAPVAERRMFGGLAFLLGGHLAISASGRGGILVRVSPADSEHLLEEPGVELMQMGGRAPMAGWLHVAPDAVINEAALARWIDRGMQFAGSLPPKG